MRLGPRVAVAVAGSCSSDWTPSLGIFICLRCGQRERERKREGGGEKGRKGKKGLLYSGGRQLREKAAW